MYYEFLDYSGFNIFSFGKSEV